MQRYNDLASRVDARLSMSEGVDSDVFILPNIGDNGREFKDVKSGLTLGQARDNLREVCDEVVRLQTHLVLSREETIEYRHKVSRWTTILDRCGYNWEDCVPYIPCLDRQKPRSHFINQKTAINKEPEPKPKPEPNPNPNPSPNLSLMR